MALSPEDIKVFQEAYKKDLDDAEASDLAERQEQLYRLILTKPDAPALETLTAAFQFPAVGK